MFKHSIVLILSFMLFTSAMAGEAFMVDTKSSQAEWVGRKVTGQHNGAINIKSGMLHLEDGKLVGGEFEIDMTTIVNHDVEDEEWRTKLVNHLKSDDFFSVDKFPVAVFKITHVESTTDEDGNNYLIRGGLTIKGITHPIEFPAKVEINGDKISATAAITVDRAKHDIRFRSGSFFENLGDKLIYDEFTINVDLVVFK